MPQEMLDLVQEAFFAAAKGDSALSAKITDAAGRFGWFLGGIPGSFRMSDSVAAVTVDAETAIARGAHEDVTLTLSVAAHRHRLAGQVAADILRLFHPGAGRQWKPLVLGDGAAGHVRREFADWSNDPTSELARRTMRFRVIVGRPRGT